MPGLGISHRQGTNYYPGIPAVHRYVQAEANFTVHKILRGRKHCCGHRSDYRLDNQAFSAGISGRIPRIQYGSDVPLLAQQILGIQVRQPAVPAPACIVFAAPHDLLDHDHAHCLAGVVYYCRQCGSRPRDFDTADDALYILLSAICGIQQSEAQSKSFAS